MQKIILRIFQKNMKKYLMNEFNITFIELNSFKGSHKFCDAYISNYFENN